MKSAPPTCGQVRRLLTTAIAVGAGSLLACLLVNCFFAPRFILWRALHVPEVNFIPEVNRAADALKQLENPGVRIENPSNRVVNWRLLFPYLGHFLHVPASLYLALPHVGCLLAVACLFRVLWKHTCNWLWAFLGASSLAASDWFFVSMGWLAYFDSWLVLGMLVVAFSASRTAVALACLLTPWVDERFALAAAGCVLARWLYQRDWVGRSRGDVFRDCVLIAALVLPYVALRGILTLAHDAGSGSHFRETWTNVSHTSWLRFAEGFWAGFRAAWFFLLAFGVMVWKRGPQMARIAAAAVAVSLSGIALVIAGDISRSMAMLLPLCALGLLWLASRRPRLARIALPGILLANLLLPAEHVINTFKIPVRSVWRELDNWRNPPAYLDPTAHLNAGMKLLDAGRTAEARRFFDNAIRLDPRLPDAYLARGTALLRERDLAAARRDFDQALQLRPGWADALRLRGLTHGPASDQPSSGNPRPSQGPASRSR